MNYKFELKADEDKITIDNIKVLKSLGQGQFGKVYLIKCDATTNNYALKIVKKKAVIEQGIEKHIRVLFSDSHYFSKRRKLWKWFLSLSL